MVEQSRKKALRACCPKYINCSLICYVAEKMRARGVQVMLTMVLFINYHPNQEVQGQRRQTILFLNLTVTDKKGDPQFESS